LNNWNDIFRMILKYKKTKKNREIRSHHLKKTPQIMKVIKF